MADQPNKRLGCGCLPLVGLFFVGSLALRALEAATDSDVADGVIAAVVIAALVLFVGIGAARRRRRTEASDTASDGGPTTTGVGASTGPIPPPVVVKPAGPTRHRIDLPVATREEPETRVLRRHLSEAVADITKEVESKDSASPTLTSEEMIARAKRRIADWRD